MTNEYVQVNVRMTKKQRQQLKEIADKNNTSMNQYIIDRTLARKNDRTKLDDDMTDDRQEADPIIEILKQELDKSERQLNKKDEQIDKLQKILDQQQQLNLQTNQQVERLQLENTEITDDKKGFFARIFKS